MADYDPKNFFEIERLHRAAQEGNLPEMEQLVQNGYSLELFDDLGRTPLHYAVEHQHFEAVEWLLKKGANVNSNDEQQIGDTPLAYAVQTDSPELVELLLRHGANPDISGWMGQTARTKALQRQSPLGLKIALLLERYCPKQSK